MELGVGQALTFFLDEEGIPQRVMRTDIICPQSLMGPVDEAVRRNLMAADPMAKYDEYVDNESAYEILQEQAKEEMQSWLEAERRKAQIERTLINTGAQVLKRGLFKTLFK